MSFSKNIDLFEYGFLLEACIPPSPIARSSFFTESIVDYRQMNDEERTRLYRWMMNNDRMSSPRLSMSAYDRELIEKWKSRYNPDNQYRVVVKGSSENDFIEAFRYNGKYHTNTHTYIAPELITKVSKL